MASSKSREIEKAINMIHKQNQAPAKIFDKLQERKSRRRKFEYTEQTFLDFYGTSEVKPNEPPFIKTLYCKTRHGSNCLANEKKILRDITTTLKTRKEIGSSKLVNNKVPKTLQIFHLFRSATGSSNISFNNQTHFMGMTSNANAERLKQKIQVITKDIRSIENHLDRINKNK
ncbi:hypothetical protein R3W88_033503 [Solanum pinnatisectum]|uniref:Uncharacterized protein n=1 Tax=Solanum pinnatisectum TaxID=50273 RepID=A0AAV9K167_9SOLN|nr:hypothetical protein R3W88_033503 [Solanum pinnatisectum]